VNLRVGSLLRREPLFLVSSNYRQYSEAVQLLPYFGLTALVLALFHLLVASVTSAAIPAPPTYGEDVCYSG
jgi:hypothetical protein